MLSPRPETELLVEAVLDSANPRKNAPPEEEKKVDVPTDLNYSDVTHNSAVLTWKGTTTSYEIEVGDVISKVVTAKTLTANELSPETEYEWRVRAIDGDRKSEWVNGGLQQMKSP